MSISTQMDQALRLTQKAVSKQAVPVERSSDLSLRYSESSVGRIHEFSPSFGAKGGQVVCHYAVLDRELVFHRSFDCPRFLYFWLHPEEIPADPVQPPFQAGGARSQKKRHKKLGKEFEPQAFFAMVEDSAP